METSNVNHKSKYSRLSHHISLGGSAKHNVFFFNDFCGKAVKRKITILKYKKGYNIYVELTNQNFKNNFILQLCLKYRSQVSISMNQILKFWRCFQSNLFGSLGKKSFTVALKIFFWIFCVSWNKSFKTFFSKEINFLNFNQNG